MYMPVDVYVYLCTFTGATYICVAIKNDVNRRRELSFFHIYNCALRIISPILRWSILFSSQLRKALLKYSRKILRTL